MKICGKCGYKTEKGNFCIHCGTPLTEKKEGRKHCPYCGYPLDVGLHCSYCGSLITGEDSALERKPLTKDEKITFNPFIDKLVEMPLREMIIEKEKEK